MVSPSGRLGHAHGASRLLVDSCPRIIQNKMCKKNGAGIHRDGSHTFESLQRGSRSQSHSVLVYPAADSAMALPCGSVLREPVIYSLGGYERND